MTLARLTARLALTLLLLTLSPTVRADAPPPPAKLKTQKVSFKTAREDPEIKGAGLERTIELVQLPTGAIRMADADGKERDHAVKPIWIAKYETRWDEYNAFWRRLDMTDEQELAWRNPDPDLWRRERGMRERPEMPPEPPWGHKSLNAVLPREPPWAKGLRSAVSLEAKGYPANCIHFQAAVKYCAWLSKLTGRKFRLPTEAEWEYACRAGGPRAKPDAKALADLAWFAGNSADEPHPVGEKRPNAWGLYDMLGNVGEYVVRDPNDDKGLAAGGSFEDEAKDVNSGAREPYSPAWGKNDPFDPKSTNWFLYDVHHLGFRVVMDE